jgi:hypothetical protein
MRFLVKTALIVTAVLIIQPLVSPQTRDPVGAGRALTLRLYPHEYDEQPNIPSPHILPSGVEVVAAETETGKYALVPVTVENGEPLLYSRRIKSLFGKDRQLLVDSGDFPTLAKTGLHSESELDGKVRITDLPVSVITHIGRPGRFSVAGFMASDEDIISVLKGDNGLVRRLGLTHPRLARPLFHIWNIILKEIELGRMGRFWRGIPAVRYNGGRIALRASAAKGWQVSIFQDEIQGRFDLHVIRELSEAEKLLLRKRYSHLDGAELTELERILSHLHFSEMAPYYIMRYGFYEGHTSYRTDPIAIALIFGLKSLDEIDTVFDHKLDTVLRKHFNR